METAVACWRWVGVDATWMNPANVVGGTGRERGRERQRVRKGESDRNRWRKKKRWDEVLSASVFPVLSAIIFETDICIITHVFLPSSCFHGPRNICDVVLLFLIHASMQIHFTMNVPASTQTLHFLHPPLLVPASRKKAQSALIGL